MRLDPEKNRHGAVSKSLLSGAKIHLPSLFEDVCSRRKWLRSHWNGRKRRFELQSREAFCRASLAGKWSIPPRGKPYPSRGLLIPCLYLRNPCEGKKRFPPGEKRFPPGGKEDPLGGSGVSRGGFQPSLLGKGDTLPGRRDSPAAQGLQEEPMRSYRTADRPESGRRSPGRLGGPPRSLCRSRECHTASSSARFRREPQAGGRGHRAVRHGTADGWPFYSPDPPPGDKSPPL